MSALSWVMGAEGEESLFMAETAKILNPAKTVLIPSERAGCGSVSPGVPIVAYVNTYADVKAEIDVCDLV